MEFGTIAEIQNRIEEIRKSTNQGDVITKAFLEGMKLASSMSFTSGGVSRRNYGSLNDRDGFHGYFAEGHKYNYNDATKLAYFNLLSKRTMERICKMESVGYCNGSQYFGGIYNVRAVFKNNDEEYVFYTLHWVNTPSHTSSISIEECLEEQGVNLSGLKDCDLAINWLGDEYDDKLAWAVVIPIEVPNNNLYNTNDYKLTVREPIYVKLSKDIGLPFHVVIDSNKFNNVKE